MSSENGNILDLGSIDFTPDWAKKDAGVNVGRIRPERVDAEAGRNRPEGRRGGNSPDGGAGAAGRRSFGDRKPSARKPFGEKKPFGRPRFEERPKPLDAEVKILPETKALGTIIRKLQSDTHAYKLKDLAYFFLDNPQSILLKITPRDSSVFFQCKACGFASTNESDVLEHIATAHLGEYYESREIACEPPKGNFSCVARCGLSGVLLGPPNLHEFNSIVREMIRTRYPEMSEEQYRSHIEMVRDADAIETWRAGATTKTVFVAKAAGGEAGEARQLSREQAEGEFRRAILPSLIEVPKHLMITADVAMKSPVRPLQWAARDAVERERRAPYNMCFALRGAFHHRKLKFFRVNEARGQEFVTNVDYREFDVEHAIPELVAAAKFVAEHPCCDKTEFPADPEFEKHLAWLVTTGHVVAFTNGVYSAVEKFPKYGPQWKKRAAAGGPKPAEAGERVEPVEPVEHGDDCACVKEEVKDETAPVVAE